MRIKEGQIYYDTTLDCLWLIKTNLKDVCSLFEIDCGLYTSLSDRDGYDDFIYIGKL